MSLSRLIAPAAIASLALAPAPVLAKEARPLAPVIDELSDPARQDQLAAALEGLTEALLDVEVAPFIKAAERAAPGRAPREIDPDATLADLAGPGTREVPRQLADKLPMMMDMMGAMAGEMEGMLPELEAMGKRLEGKLGEAARRERPRRD